MKSLLIIVTVLILLPFSLIAQPSQQDKPENSLCHTWLLKSSAQKGIVHEYDINVSPDKIILLTSKLYAATHRNNTDSGAWHYNAVTKTLYLDDGTSCGVEMKLLELTNENLILEFKPADEVIRLTFKRENSQ